MNTSSITINAAGAMQPAISPSLLSLYLRCRREKPWRASGRDAECSLRAARTILAFRDAEKRGLVRMRAEEEQESYLDVYGEPEPRRGQTQEEATAELVRVLERDGVWWTVAEWFDGDEWQQADSCGMHTGYRDPLDPFQNCYVVQEMQSALDALQAHIDEQEAENVEIYSSRGESIMGIV